MGDHDTYGKAVLKQAVGSTFADNSVFAQVDYSGTRAYIDGVVGNDIAVEIESRVSKQVRGALLDLICHTYPKKLLILLPVHMSNPQSTLAQCCFILAKFVKPANFRVLLLRGSGSKDQMAEDVATVRNALVELGFPGVV